MGFKRCNESYIFSSRNFLKLSNAIYILLNATECMCAYILYLINKYLMKI